MELGARWGEPSSTLRPAARAAARRTAIRLRSVLDWSIPNGDPVGTLIRSHRTIHSGGDAALLRRAYAVAEEMHRGQMRKSGEPYITHPLAVAQILAELGMDTTTLAAALLHDTVEDTEYTLPALRKDFGPEVSLLVDGVTKFDKVFYGDAAEAETMRKMIVAAGQDVRVLIIKLADRLHNMRTLGARSVASRARIARATNEVLVPLCDRLGIQALKRDLEDCVLQALRPEAYALIADHVKHRQGWQDYLDQVIRAASAELRRSKVDAKVEARPHHLYSIWRDTVGAHRPEPYEPPRIVITVDGPETDCYAALGVIHGRWRPVPGRFKDFIGSPKNNLYRSLHTTVLGPDHTAVEVLIRTAAMHRSAEYGIVANFRYPRHVARSGELSWLDKMLDWQKVALDSAQFLASLRCDLAESQIIVFTPQGQQVILPAEATPVDLAYTLGPQFGHRCIGAQRGGRLIPLSSPLVDGDVVEIITRESQDADAPVAARRAAQGPSPEWLNFVRTVHARLHINAWFSELEDSVETIPGRVRKGRAAIAKELRRHDRALASDAPLLKVAPVLGYPDTPTLLVAVADEKVCAGRVVEELIASVDVASKEYDPD